MTDSVNGSIMIRSPFAISRMPTRKGYVVLHHLSFGASFVYLFVQAMIEQPIVALNRRGAGIVRYSHRSGTVGSFLSHADLSVAWAVLLLITVFVLEYFSPGTLLDGIGAIAMAVPAKVVIPDMIYSGSKIMLPNEPKPMDLDTAIQQLLILKQDEETTINMQETFDAYPWDGARAFMMVVKEKYGSAAAKKNFFGERTSSMINVKIAHNRTESILWGRFELPNIPGTLSTGMDYTDKGPRFELTATIQKKYAGEIKQLCQRTRELLTTESIYRGAPVLFQWDENNSQPKVPEFLDLSRIDPNELIFSADVTEQVETTVFTPLLKREWCSELGIPFKRGICLVGVYGTGKTQAAYVAARHAIDKGITVVLVEDAEHLPYAMQFARTYAPALVICEDIDRVTAERDSTCNYIMDALDGVEAKGTDVMVLFTSNEPDRIHAAMRRAGRIDTFIKVNPPDTIAVEKLLRMYGRGQIDFTSDLSKVCELLAGQIPALVREVVERARLASVKRARTIDEAYTITAEDLEISANRLRMQQELFREKNVEAAQQLEEIAGFGARLVTNISAIAKRNAVQLLNQN